MEQTLKRIPYSLTKQQLVDICHPLSRSKVVRRINEIIYDSRKTKKEYTGKSKDDIIRSKEIEYSEIKEYFETYGMPPGYHF